MLPVPRLERRVVSSWLADLDNTVYGLLVERGLAEPREKAGTLSIFMMLLLTVARTSVIEGVRSYEMPSDA